MVAILALAVSFMGIIVIPTLILVVRAAIRWKGVEDRMNSVANDLGDIVRDKDRIHAEMIAQMREDRKATDRRLRWLEENLWSGRINRGHPST